MRLDKFLSNAGLASRSEIKHFFKDKRVLVNDQLKTLYYYEYQKYFHIFHIILFLLLQNINH